MINPTQVADITPPDQLPIQENPFQQAMDKIVKKSYQKSQAHKNDDIKEVLDRYRHAPMIKKISAHIKKIK